MVGVSGGVSFKVSASIVATEKPPIILEIVLQPIKEIFEDHTLAWFLNSS